MDISEKEQYLSEIARLKSVVSELESRTFVQETIRIRESQPSSAPVHRRTVGLMVKPPCRDVAINIFIEEAKPAQRSVGVNVSFEDGRKQTRTAVKSVPNAEPPKDRELVSRSAESNEYQRNNFSSNSTSISTVSSQRLMFFQSLRQSYGISAAEMVNIITELLKRDVKSVGLQVCMDASPEPPGISSDVDELNREHGILKASDHFIDRKDTTSMRTYSSGSRFDSSVVKRRYETDYTTNSTSDSLERSTFDGDGDRLSSPDSGSSIKDSAQLSSITARTDSGWQGQEESSNQEFQFTSDDGTVTTSRTIASRHILSRQVPPHSTFSNSSSGAHTSAFQQQVSSVFPSGTQGYETPQPIEEDSRLDGMALDSGNRVQNSMLQSQSSFSQSAQQTNSTTVSSVAQSKSVQQVNRTAVSSMTQSVEHNSSTAMSSMTQSRHQFGQQQLQLLELLKTNASAF
ncbi:hypothetical protein BOX15_Mlig004348g5 [Macrostomum lignano]|uniref:Uncharacterized protein n=1 Tax=Macrostomum lignano TaxID=282301 RepID=A0A267ECL0_9PLAT|nr:hypothetical protein BOX15_Mlig004348g5 [Macrostomum lignano]